MVVGPDLGSESGHEAEWEATSWRCWGRGCGGTGGPSWGPDSAAGVGSPRELEIRDGVGVGSAWGIWRMGAFAAGIRSGAQEASGSEMTDGSFGLGRSQEGCPAAAARAFPSPALARGGGTDPGRTVLSWVPPRQALAGSSWRHSPVSQPRPHGSPGRSMFSFVLCCLSRTQSGADPRPW